MYKWNGAKFTFEKRWLVSLLVVSFAFLPKAIDGRLLCLLIRTITLSFWYLDVFLKTEELYRQKYEWVILERLKSNHDYLFDLNSYNNNMWLSDSCKKVNTLEVMFSKALISFYVLVLNELLLFSLLNNVGS